MKVLVCGGRDFADYAYLCSILSAIKIEVLVAGGCRGADLLARKYAFAEKIPYVEYPAEWDRYGKSAGFRRNEDMARREKPDLVVAFKGGNGTAHMKTIAKQYGIAVQEFNN